MNTPGKLFVLFSIIISLSCRAGDKSDQSPHLKAEDSVSDSGYPGVIDDPSGYVNVLGDKQPDAAIIANVKTGERVSFECKEGDKWCKVTLGSRKSGWVPSNCIKRYFTIKDWPRKGGELGEANSK